MKPFYCLCGAASASLFSLTLVAPALAQKVGDKTPETKAPTPAPQSSPTTPKAPSYKEGYQFFGSFRARVENQNFFPTDKADGAYSFVGTTLRLGISRQTKHEEMLFELSAPGLFNLPTQANATVPQGALGQGANYRNENGGRVAGAFLKQGYFRFKGLTGATDSLKLGRFEFSDGAETVSTSGDVTLSWLKQNRVAQRLIGPFNFTHIGRAFDGVQFGNATPTRNSSIFAGFPTRGVFSLNGGDTLLQVRFAYAQTTVPIATKSAPGEYRLFGIYYDDSRSKTTKTDNRPLAARQADRDTIKLLTGGGHYLRNFALGKGGGKLDTLLWGAGQFGTWGKLHHAAYAYDAEVGYQPKNAPANLWLRAGFYYASGDGSKANGSNNHNTFFPILPTPRLYARYPFYSETNLQDAFVQAIIKPSAQWTLRADYHNLSLANASDLWYSGGGAYDNASFGYAGKPSGGFTSLANLFDLSVDYVASKSLTVSGYLAYAMGGSVVKTNYKSGDSVFAYLEATYKF